jgi:hypothetical protein
MTGTSVATMDEDAAALPAPAPQSLLPAIIGLAKDPAMDADKLERLLAMQERMEARQAEREFNAAFVQMAPKLPRIKKDGTLQYPVNKNEPEGRQKVISRYATWEAIDSAIRQVLSDHGFSLSFTSELTATGIPYMIAILRHSAGHSTKTPGPPLPCDSSGGKNNIQGWGSAMQYGKRYAATAALNLVTENEDDDGKLAGMAFLRDEQIAELRRLIEETDTNERRFLDIFGVADLTSIEQGAFAAARNMLLQKQQQRKKEPVT